MKKFVHLLSVILALGMFSYNSSMAQCVEVGDVVGELAPQLKSVGGVCGPAAVETNVCDCPDGYVAVGYQGLEGNQWGAEVLSQFSLRCKEVNPDGSLGAVVEVTCSNGTGAGNQTDGPIDAGPGEALVGFELRLGCAVDAVMGESKPLTEIAAGDPNTNSNSIMRIGGGGGSPQPITYVPDGNVVVGMRVYEDPSTNLSGGVAWRYAPINDVVCPTNCSITSISISNTSACDDGGSDDDASDDTYTADITVNFVNPPAGGNLVLTGSASATVAVGGIGATSHTFTGLTLSSNGSPIIVTARFSDEPVCDLSSNLGSAPPNCSPNAPQDGIPTMSEWGLILFALIMFTISVVFGTQHQRSMSMANVGTTSGSGRSRFPFQKDLYFKALPLVYLAITLIFTVAIVFTGYELTNADVPGSLIAGSIIAYLVHFVMIPSQESEE